MSFEKDDFWNLEKLLPKKNRSLPSFSTGEKLTLVEIKGDNEKNDNSERKITAEAPKTAVSESLRFEYKTGFLRSVTIKKFIDKYDFYGNFRKAALIYYDYKTPKCEFVKFYSYMPQYSQFDVQQKNYYFFWRDSVRRGKYIKTDYSYFYLYVYEILNLPDKIPAKEGLKMLIDLWRAYRKALPNIDSNMSLWVADYCMIYNLPCPMAEIADFIFDIISVAEFKEFYLGDVMNMGSDGISAMLAYLSDYDWRRGKYAGGDNKEVYSKHMLSAMGNLLSHLVKNGILLGDNSELATVFRSAFRNSLCTHMVKCRLEIEYIPLSKADNIRMIVTSAIKYTENKLRALLSVKSRLSVKDFPTEYKNIIDCYFSELFDKVNMERQRAAMPEYEKLYDAESTGLSFEGADEIERASWATTTMLVPEDELSEEVEEAVIQRSEDSFGLSKEEVAILSAIFNAEINKAKAIAQELKTPIDAAIEKINEAFFDNFGDVIIEGDSSDYHIIEDYKDDIKEWICKQTE